MKVITKDSFVSVTDWAVFVEAIDAGHALPKAEVRDVVLVPQGNTLFSRAARIEGIGFVVKSLTVLAENTRRGLPSVQGGMLVFDEETGTPEALIDSALITDIKTAAASALGTRYPARPDARQLAMVGAGSVGRNVIAAFCQLFPQIERVIIWNRTPAEAGALAEKMRDAGHNIRPSADLASTVSGAGTATCATLSVDPILQGKWLRPGTHVDLIGAFCADMREANDDVLTRGQIYVDSRDTTLDHIGEMKIPLAARTIS